MTRLVWGELPPGYFAGLQRGVLYVDGIGVAWSGLLSVDEDPGEVTQDDFYYDGVNYISTSSEETFSGSISAFTYPDEFAPFDAFENPPSIQRFGLCYRVETETGYDLHILYNVSVVADAQSYESTDASPTAVDFKWSIQSADEDIMGWRPTAHLIVSYGPNPAAIALVEAILYGDDENDARLPTPDELIDLYDQFATLHIHYNGDGSYTASGPAGWVDDHGDGSFDITAPTVHVRDDGIFSVRSY